MDFSWRIERIVSQVSVYNFLDWIGEPTIPDDRPHQIRCPFTTAHAHADMNPSARVYPDSGKLHCFTEAKTRDIIDAVSDYYGLDLPHAVAFVEQKMGWEVSPVTKLRQALAASRTTNRKPKPLCEESILELMEKLRKILSSANYQELSPIFIWIWDVFESDRVRVESLEKQVEWEKWAKAVIGRQLGVIRDVRAYKPG